MLYVGCLIISFHLFVYLLTDCPSPPLPLHLSLPLSLSSSVSSVWPISGLSICHQYVINMLAICYQFVISILSVINRDRKRRDKLTSDQSGCCCLCGEMGGVGVGGATEREEGGGSSQFRPAAGHQLRLRVLEKSSFGCLSHNQRNPSPVSLA